MRRIAFAVGVGALSALLAGPAHAATLHGENGTLTYTAGPGFANVAQFMQTGPAQVQFTNRDDGDPVTATGTCAKADFPPVPVRYLCDDITVAVVADGGDGNDELSAHVPNLQARIAGGEGDDLLIGARWAEALDGGPGDDELVWGGGGADSLIGGPGTDVARVNVLADPPPPVSITLDDVANDGPAGTGLDVRSDIEDVSGQSVPASGSGPPFGLVTIVGSAGANTLTGFGPAQLTGGEGPDTLTGSAHDDTIDSADESADVVTCGAGADAARVDGQDTVALDCEAVTYAERVVPAGMTLKVRAARRARFTVSGRVVRPSTVPARRACGAGRVRITVTARKRKVATRTAKLRADCSYRSSFAVRRGKHRRLRFGARYAGNAVLATATAKAVSARVRR